jgi:hypothetical protein
MAAPVVVIGAYFALLGWHQLQSYDRWKVETLIGLLAALAAWSGWRGPLVLGPLAITASLTALWTADAVSIRLEQPDLWPVGATMLVFATGFGSFFIAFAARSIRLALRRRSTPPAR